MTKTKILNSIVIIVLLIALLGSGSGIWIGKYCVLVLEETSQRDTEQLNVIQSQVWRDYVKDHGGEWRVLDPDADISEDKDWVRELSTVPRTVAPWIVVSSRSGGYSGPVPKSIDAMLEIVK